MNNKNKYTVIIPTLNEEKYIVSCIKNIKSCLLKVEIIVSDGGSTDKTIEIAEDNGAKILFTNNGRGAQLNLGVKSASGDILIFLHADTLLPNNTNVLIDNIFADDNVKVATFKMKFDIDNWILNFYSWFTRFNSIFTRFGDCGIAVRKNYFTDGNFFPNWKLFEDVHFLRQARKTIGVNTLPGFVTTSTRRFLQNGFIKTQIRNSIYIMQYLINKKPDELYSKYNKMKRFNKNAIIVFARFPTKGKVKTRLAKTLGGKFAKDFYKICAEHTFNEILKIHKNDTRKFIFYSDEKDREKIKKWTHSKFLLSPQKGKDLGEKMQNAFQTVFNNGVSKTLIIGTDLPEISSEIINRSFELLNNNDIVIGPATDGGYYLLGMKNVYKELFTNLPWSTDKLFENTIDIINKLNLSISYLPRLSDIDTEEDLKYWLNQETIYKPEKIKSFVKISLIIN